MMDHDRLLKELLSRFFIEFVELFLPQMAADLDRNYLTFLDQELFTHTASGERQEADLIAKARFKNRNIFFLLRIENQPQPQPEFGRHLFRTFSRLHNRYASPVYPVVIFSYDKPKRLEPNLYQVIFPDKAVLEFHYEVIQLNRLNWREYAKEKNPLAAALMAKMSMKPEERARVKFESLRMLATLRLDRAQVQLLSGFIDTYLRLKAGEEMQFQADVKRIKKRERRRVMEIVTSWMEQGIRQGLQQGKQLEALTLITRQLNRRLGNLDKRTNTRIEKLTLAKLEDLGEALLDFSSKDDLKSWLDTQAGNRATTRPSRKRAKRKAKKG